MTGTVFLRRQRASRLRKGVGNVVDHDRTPSWQHTPCCRSIWFHLQLIAGGFFRRQQQARCASKKSAIIWQLSWVPRPWLRSTALDKVDRCCCCWLVVKRARPLETDCSPHTAMLLRLICSSWISRRFGVLGQRRGASDVHGQCFAEARRRAINLFLVLKKLTSQQSFAPHTTRPRSPQLLARVTRRNVVLHRAIAVRE